MTLPLIPSTSVPVLHFTPPNKQTPGFAKRLKRALVFQQQISSGNATPQLVDDIIQFLADYIKDVPRDLAVELLYDASEEQFMDMLTGITGSEEAQVPPPSGVPSDTP
jgi:hypothetical protein